MCNLTVSISLCSILVVLMLHVIGAHAQFSWISKLELTLC